MKTVVVYYSLNGHTECAAKAVAEKTGASLLGLKAARKYPNSTACRYFIGGMEAVLGIKRKLKPYVFSPGYDRVVLATPVWGGKITPALNSFIADNNLTGSEIFLIACSAGGDIKGCITALEKKTGKLKSVLSLIDPTKKSLDDNAELFRFCEDVKAN